MRHVIIVFSNEQRGGGGRGGVVRISHFVIFSLFNRPRAGLATM